MIKRCTKPIEKITKYRSFIPDFPLDQFQIDLIYLDNQHLNRAKYRLTCIDVLSKKADVELLKKRTEKDTLEAFKK